MKKNIIIFSIINAIIVFGLSISTIYLTQINVIVLGISPFVLFLLLSILSAYFYKKENPEDASFRSLFLAILGGLSFGLLGGTLLCVGFYLSLSEETKILLENRYLENQFSSLNHLADPLTLLDTLEKAADNLFNIEYQFIGMFFNAFLNVFYSAVVALCMKKEF